jgi:LPS-assembly protein
VNRKRRSLLTLLMLLPLAAESRGAERITPSCMAQPVDDSPALDLSGKVRIAADSGEVLLTRELIILDGDVEITSGAQSLRANEVRYDLKSRSATAAGDVIMAQPGFEVRSRQATYDMTSQTAELEEVSYRVIEHGGQGTAERATLRRTGASSFQEISYSTCPPEKEDWRIAAKRIEIDREKGTGTAVDAAMKIRGTTVLKVPRFIFPIDDRRMSGVLVPRLGYSTTRGLDLVVPYYFNLAPNYDATLYPRITTRRGIALGAEFRYLTEKHAGEMFGEIFPDDPDSPEGENTRYVFGYDHISRFNSHLKGKINYDYVSDDTYLEDFGSPLAISSSRYAVQSAELSYDEDYWNSYLRVQKLQVIDQETEPAYVLLPQLGAHWYRQYDNGLITRLDAELSNFDKENAVTGARFDVRPAIGAGFLSSRGHFRTMLSGRYTSYELQNTSAGDPSSITRSLYTASLDTGLFFERRLDWAGNSGYQTLEPRLFYLYTPYRDQSDIPAFDTKLADFTFANFFRENRFTGADRVGDANQLALAVTSRFIQDGSQKEWFRTSIGQIFYFEDRLVQLDDPDSSQPFPPETGDYGAFVAEVYAQLNEIWSTESVVEWDFEQDRLYKGLMRISYHDTAADRFMSIGYKRDISQNAEYTDLSFRFPINDQLKAIGRWQYSLEDDLTLDLLGGLEYDTCCWGLRGIAQRHRNSTGNRYETNFYIQLVLKGLGNLGKSDMNSFLSRNVYGYNGFDYY